MSFDTVGVVLKVRVKAQRLPYEDIVRVPAELALSDNEQEVSRVVQEYVDKEYPDAVEYHWIW